MFSISACIAIQGHMCKKTGLLNRLPHSYLKFEHIFLVFQDRDSLLSIKRMKSTVNTDK